MKIKFPHLLGMLIVSAIMVLCGNAILYVRAHPELPAGLIPYWESVLRSIPGMLILFGFTFAGVLCKRYIPLQLPAAAYIVTIGCVLSIPGAPNSTGPVSQFMNALSGAIMKYVNEVSFMSLTTPVLAYAGLSLAKDLGALKESGWKLVVVALFVFIGTFIGSALIADLTLRAMGQL
ncbi:MAG: DUF340 domain-containing protein [Synergistaceae bacterium]|jgi:putative effector of murein hydrolase LrgA (UPF0299 family)|nr:DUF340 domain-containing protein [Synergistaceae bacterium]